MTISELSPTQHPAQERLKGRLVTRHLRPGNEAFLEWMISRQDYVEKRGWKDMSHGDYDRYDEMIETDQLAIYDADVNLLYGMRLTPIGAIQDALSWEMIQHSTMDQKNILNKWQFSQQGIWDLTRLIPGGSTSFRTAFEAIPLLFGEGLRSCQARGDADPVWLFVMDSKLRQWLEKQGVNIQVLEEGFINGDEAPSTLGFFQPARLAALGEHHSFSARAMKEVP